MRRIDGGRLFVVTVGDRWPEVPDSLMVTLEGESFTGELSDWRRRFAGSPLEHLSDRRVRYYISLGLVDAPQRAAAGRRTTFSVRHICQCWFIAILGGLYGAKIRDLQRLRKQRIDYRAVIHHLRRMDGRLVECKDETGRLLLRDEFWELVRQGVHPLAIRLRTTKSTSRSNERSTLMPSRRRLARALARHGGNAAMAAAQLELTDTQFNRLVEKNRTTVTELTAEGVAAGDYVPPRPAYSVADIAGSGPERAMKI